MKRLYRDLWLLARYGARVLERVTDALIERSNRREGD